MLNEFKKFILRGNVIDLAVGVVIGAAFNSVVQAFVRDIISPIITAVTGGTSRFADAHFVIRGSSFAYGDLINAIISFLLIALVIFFFVVQPINKLTEIAMRSKSTPEETTMKCPYCLSTIPKEATRCKYCTAKLDSKKD